jgi:hypothetical protein
MRVSQIDIIGNYHRLGGVKDLDRILQDMEHMVLVLLFLSHAFLLSLSWLCFTTSTPLLLSFELSSCTIKFPF